jgi:hypothetical protein
MRKQTRPSTKKKSTSSTTSRKGLTAKFHRRKQSAGTESILDGRSHRTFCVCCPPPFPRDVFHRPRWQGAQRRRGKRVLDEVGPSGPALLLNHAAQILLNERQDSALHPRLAAPHFLSAGNHVIGPQPVGKKPSTTG